VRETVTGGNMRLVQPSEVEQYHISIRRKAKVALSRVKLLKTTMVTRIASIGCSEV
jgi:hypothetical protein